MTENSIQARAARASQWGARGRDKTGRTGSLVRVEHLRLDTHRHRNLLPLSRAERRDVLDATRDERNARGVARRLRRARRFRLRPHFSTRFLLVEPTITLKLIPRVEQLREVCRRELGEELVRLGRLRGCRDEVALLGTAARSLRNLALRLAVCLGFRRSLRVEVRPASLVRRRADVPVPFVLLVIRDGLGVLREVRRASLGRRARVGVRVRGRRALDLRFLRRGLADVGPARSSTVSASLSAM